MRVPASSLAVVNVPRRASARRARFASPLLAGREGIPIPSSQHLDLHGVPAGTDRHTDVVGRGVLRRVGEGLPDDGDHVLRERPPRDEIDRPVEVQQGDRRERPREVVDDVEHAVAERVDVRVGTEGQHRGPDLADRRIDEADRVQQVVDHRADGHRRGGGPQLETGGEQLLDRRVVQIPRDPRPLLEQDAALAVGARLRELDHHGGVTDEGRQEVEVGRVERRRARIPADEHGSDDAIAAAHRDDHPRDPAVRHPRRRFRCRARVVADRRGAPHRSTPGPPVPDSPRTKGLPGPADRGDPERAGRRAPPARG